MYMFKKIVKIYILLSILLFSMVCVSCKRTELTPEEMIIEIFCDYANAECGYKRFKPEDIKIKYYLGQYGDSYCAFMENHRSPIPEIWPYYVTIEGETFEFMDIPNILMVFYKDNCYYLQDACDKGILTLEDVKALHDYCTKYIF